MRVLIVDDSIIVREGLRRLLEAEGHQVVGVADDGKQALTVLAGSAADAVILDVRMPPTFTDEGVAVANTLRQQQPGLAVLVLSQYANADYATRLLENGAARIGYLLKDRISAPDQLCQALRRLAEGGTVIDTVLVDELFAHRGRADRLARLTDRETQVLRLMAEGRSDRGIATTLYITLNTVSTHVQRIFHKLDLPDTAAENRRVLAVLTFLQGSDAGPSRNT